MNTENIVQENLNHYNNHDIEGFMSCLGNSIQLFTLGEKEPSISGFEEIREFYSSLFNNSPSLHSTILKRIIIGNKVIDHESIVGRNGSDELVELVLIYEVEEDKIIKITVVRP